MTDKEFKSARDYAQKILGLDLADSVDNLTDSIASDLNRLSFGFDDDRLKYRSYQSLNSLPPEKKTRPESMPVFGEIISRSDVETRPASAKTTNESLRLTRQVTRRRSTHRSSSSSVDTEHQEQRQRPKKKKQLRAKNFTRLLSQIKQIGSKDGEKEESSWERDMQTNIIKTRHYYRQTVQTHTSNKCLTLFSNVVWFIVKVMNSIKLGRRISQHGRVSLNSSEHTSNLCETGHGQNKAKCFRSFTRLIYPT